MEATTQLSKSIQARLFLRGLIFPILSWFKQRGGVLAPVNAFLELFGKPIVIAASRKRTIEMYREMSKDDSIEKWNRYKQGRMYIDFPDTVDQEYKVYTHWRNKQRQKSIK